MAKIFLNYRRDDTKADAREFNRVLRKRFGAKNVFFDIRDLDEGENFRTAIDKAAIRCDVMVVLIGRRWLHLETEAGEKRLFAKEDWTRFEIERALFHDKAMLPVLIDGAAMPDAADLPESIRALAYKNAAEARHQTFEQDAEAIAQRVRGMIPPVRVSPWWVAAAAAVALLAGGLGAQSFHRAGLLGESRSAADLRAQLAELKDKYADSRDEADQNSEMARAAIADMRVKTAQLERVELEAAALTKEKTALASRIGALSSEIEELKGENQKISKRLQDRVRSLSSDAAAIKQRDDEISKVTGRLKNACDFIEKTILVDAFSGVNTAQYEKLRKYCK